VGAHASTFAQQLIDKGVDFVCIGEYEHTVLELLNSDKDKSSILGLYPNPRRPLLDINALPWPEDSDISRYEYSMPGEPSSEYREIQMYASRGCPMSCNFCVARHIYYNQPNWRCRNTQDIIAEIKYLRTKYPRMEGVFFDEEVHNAKKEFVLRLSNAIISAGLNDLHYEAMCDVRYLDIEMMEAMKKAGYYKIRIGIETASDKIMKEINKEIDLGYVKNILRAAKKIGLKTYGTFTFGALGADISEDSKTISLMKKFMRDNLLDNLQISICTPQPGTPFYNMVRDNDYLRKGIKFKQYDGGNFALVDYPKYKGKAIESMKEKAFLSRDHIYLNKKLKTRNFWKWIIEIKGKYGLLGLFFKAVARSTNEIKYQVVKWWKGV